MPDVAGHGPRPHALRSGPLGVLTGSLEGLGGAGLLVGLRWPPALWLASGGVTLLMFCGVAVRISVGDTLAQMVPALGLALVNLYLFVTAVRPA